MGDGIYVSKYLRNNQDQWRRKDVYQSKYLSKNQERGLNQYFSFNDENYNTSNEVSLVKSLQTEMIRMFGVKTVYIVRTDNTFDEIYGESIGSNFSHSFEIEMMPENPDGMIGQDSIREYGFFMADTITFHVGFDRFNDEISRLGLPDRKYPTVGDLLHVPMYGNLLEILHVEDKVIPFIKGRQTMWALSCQVFNLGDETFTTDIPDLDFMNNFDKAIDHPQSDNEHLVKEAATATVNEINSWDLDFSSGVKYTKPRK